MKKFLAALLAVMMTVMTAATALAYTPGPTTHIIDLGDYTASSGIEKTETLVNMTAGSRVVYEVYVPFNSASVRFDFGGVTGGNVTVVIDGNENSIASGNNRATIGFSPVLKKGEHQIILSADGDASIYQITFNKEDKKVAKMTFMEYTELTDFEAAIESAVILSDDSPVMFVEGAKRYVNNDDPTETPYILNGEAYLPLHAFARAFGYYYEEKGEELVFYKEDMVFLLRNGVLTKTVGDSDPVEIRNIIKRVDGVNYVPLTYFAALDGKTVSKTGINYENGFYKDYIYVIDSPSLVRNILKEENFSQVKAIFEEHSEKTTGTTYYVSKDCTACDQNDGSAAKPFKTIAKASAVAKAGDTIIIDGGTYYESIAPQNDGTAYAPITYKAAEGETVLLSAAAELGAPVATEGDILIYDALADLGVGKNQIYYKSNALAEGRHPNAHTNPARKIPDIENLSPLWMTFGNIHVNPENVYEATSETDLDQEAGYWAGGIFVTSAGYNWSLSMAKITDSAPGSITLGEVSKTWYHPELNPNAIIESDSGYITECKNTVDMPGEWYVGDGKVYIIPPEGETAETLKIEQKVRQQVINLKNRKYIRIEGIDTYGGGITMDGSEMCMLKDGEYKYISHFTFSHDQRTGYIDSYDIYNDNAAPQRGEVGIYVGGRDNVILNNKIEYSAGSGLYITGRNAYVENNYLSDCGYMGSYVSGIMICDLAYNAETVPKGGHSFFHNTVRNTGRSGFNRSNINERLTVYMPDEIAYNEFYNSDIVAKDTGMFYTHGGTIGTDKKKDKMHNNVVYDDQTVYTVYHIYYDNYVAMGEVYDNIVFNTDEELLWSTDDGIQIQVPSIFPENYASEIDVWNNTSIRYFPGGKEALTKKEFPNGRPFRIGSSFTAHALTPYLDSVDVEGPKNYAEMEAVNGGAITEKGYEPEKNGDTVVFRNVDFGDGNNSVSLEFTGDITNTGDKVTVYVGESLENYNAKKSDVELTTTSPHDWGTARATAAFFRSFKGEQNVWVVFDEYKSAKVSGLAAVNAGNTLYNGAVCGTYAIYGNLITGVTPSGGFKENGLRAVANTYAGGVVCFEGFEVTEAVDTFVVRDASAPPYNGQVMQVRLGSETGEIIAEYTCKKEDWDDFSAVDVPLNRELEAGVYDIYFTFTKNNVTQDFLWFGFKNSASADTTADAEEAQNEARTEADD